MARGQRFLCYPQNPRNINLLFGYPTGVTGDRGDRTEFMCQSFMCLYAPFKTGKKKSTKIYFLGPETAGLGGGLRCEGVGVKKSVPAFESLYFRVSKGGTRDVPGILPGCPGLLGFQRVCENNVCARFSAPIKVMQKILRELCSLSFLTGGIFHVTGRRLHGQQT